MQAVKDRSPRWVKDVANLGTRRYAVLTAGTRPAPDFLVIGTKRGGTTSLFNYMLMHPGVLGLFPRSRGKKSTDFFFSSPDRTHASDERWYRSHFHSERYRSVRARRTGYRPVGGEASPYYVWDPRIASRVRALAPDVRAILLLRDPVERAWSHYQERCSNGVEPLSFEDALAAEEGRLEGELERMLADDGYHSDAYDWYSYRSRGVYLPQIRTWLSEFPREQLLVLRSEDMYADVQGTFDRICDYLGIPGHRLPTTRTFNASRRDTLPDAARAELTAFYADHNDELAEFLGWPNAW